MGMGWFVRNATKLSILQGSKRSSLVNYGVWAESPFSSCHPQCRAYAPSPRQLSKTRVSQTFRPFYRPSFSTSFSSSSSSSASYLKMGFIGWYLGMLESRPLVTKGVTSSIIFAAADLTSQMSTMSSSDSIDSIRTLRMAAYGIIILGPAQHMWFNFVAKVLPKRDVVTTLKKLMMGQILYGPAINTVFFSYNAILQGENGGEIVARLKRDLIPTLLNGLLYWPACDFLTYKVFPVHLQLHKDNESIKHLRVQFCMGESSTEVNLRSCRLVFLDLVKFDLGSKTLMWLPSAESVNHKAGKRSA